MNTTHGNVDQSVTAPSWKAWLPEAREMAAQCWCDTTTASIPMQPMLAEQVAIRIALWMDTGAFHARNEAYWRDRAKKAERWNKVWQGLGWTCLSTLILFLWFPLFRDYLR